jgi:hypothetical protein
VPLNTTYTFTACVRSFVTVNVIAVAAAGALSTLIARPPHAASTAMMINDVTVLRMFNLLKK